jgi:hypothetical protein
VGHYNSSATRVQPIFQRLLDRDPPGADWIGPLLRSVPLSNRLGTDALAEPGTLIDKEKPRFEYPAPPSDAFLRWLIRHPDHMTWPRKQGAPLRYGPHTHQLREALFGHNGRAEQQAAHDRALRELDRVSAGRSGRRWWARSKLVRNMEVVGAVAGGRPCGVILGVEHPMAELDHQTLEHSTPHLSDDEREDLGARYLGQVRWRNLCEAAGIGFELLPDTVPQHRADQAGNRRSPQTQEASMGSRAEIWPGSITFVAGYAAVGSRPR